MKPNTTKEQEYTPAEVAKIKGCPEATLFYQLQTGKIPGAYKKKHKTTITRDMWVIPHSALESITVRHKGLVNKRKVKKNA